MDAAAASRITIDLRLAERDPAAERDELRRGLAEPPRRLPSRLFYDAEGSRLFERITHLPEYYLTRAELELLERLAGPLLADAAPTDLVELGSGAATKTRRLLDAGVAGGTLRRYVPFDVDAGVVRRAADELAVRYPTLAIHGVVADFSLQIGAIPPGERRLVAFLGSTIGNLTEPQTVAFLRGLAAVLQPRDAFLLGVDLIKDRAVLEAAYDDAEGVTAAFNRNILAVLNGKLGADFDPEAFAHRAFYDPEREWVEMRLRSRREQTVRLPALDLEIRLAAGEEILTEISTKYRRDKVARLLEAGGWNLDAWHPHPRGLFALALARKRRA